MEANPGKHLEVEVEGKPYLRIPIRTEIITADDDIVQIVETYTKEFVENG
ncbi:MAG: F420-0--gamma-glutamyl ligase, partial [Firmicutes bacterium]|nr:F420-0--gamma-glutamyl ligase [Bacillota bacterium]